MLSFFSIFNQTSNNFLRHPVVLKHCKVLMHMLIWYHIDLRRSLLSTGSGTGLSDYKDTEQTLIDNLPHANSIILRSI